MVGGATHSFSHMADFGDALLDCNFLEISVQGPLLTWTRSKSDDMIMERLDRGVANSEFFAIFP